jgi:hypothetical protein
LNPGIQRFVEQVGDDFGIGVGREFVTLGLELVFQFGKIFDNAIVNDRDAASAVGMGIADAGRAVGGPARVTDADLANQRLLVNDGFEIADLALGAAAFWALSGLNGDAGRIVAAIFQPPQRFQKARRGFRVADNADNAAHMVLSP